ncbi:MAG: hypothetical protein P4M01_08610 [Acidobacteriota bacterium]|nr:hypothetical protein [Acidobacteriota bacterium]
MSTSAITSSTETYNSTAVAQQNAAAAAARQAAEKAAEQNQANSSATTVKISVAAQARLMQQQGESVQQIANSLSTDVKTVDEYLGISTSSSSSSAAEGLAVLGAMGG